MSCLSLGNEIHPELNRRVLGIAEYFVQQPFEGLKDVVPAYSSVSLVYDPVIISEYLGEDSSVHEYISELLFDAFQRGIKSSTGSEVIEVPVDYNLNTGPDLAYIAQEKNLSIEQVIEIHCSRIYHVYMIGFLPGFPYMGKVDPRIATPRKKQPRQSVPAGSVGIAGDQTGIYPAASPGGWQIIGRTDIPLFNPDDNPPSLLYPGARVRFVRK